MYPQRVELTALSVALLCSLMVGGQDDSEKDMTWRERDYLRCARHNHLTQCEAQAGLVLVIRAAVMKITCNYCQGTCTQQAYDNRYEVLPRCALQPTCTLHAFGCDCRSAITSIQYTCVKRSSVYNMCGNETRVAANHGFLSNINYPKKISYKRCMFTIVAGPNGNVTLSLLDVHTQMGLIFAVCNGGSCQLLHRNIPVTLMGNISIYIRPTSPDDEGRPTGEMDNNGMRFLIQFSVDGTVPTILPRRGDQTTASLTGVVPVITGLFTGDHNGTDRTTATPLVPEQNATIQDQTFILRETSTFMTPEGQTPVAGLGANSNSPLSDKVTIAIVISIAVVIIVIVVIFFYIRRNSSKTLRRVIVVLVQAPSRQLSRLSRRLSRASPPREVAQVKPSNGRRKGKIFADFTEREPVPLPEMDRLRVPPIGSRPSSFDDSSAGYARVPLDRLNQLTDSSGRSSDPGDRPVSIQIHLADVPDLDDGDPLPHQPKVVTSLEPMGAGIVKTLTEGSKLKQDSKPSTSKITNASSGKTNYDVYIVENDVYKTLDRIKDVEK